MSLTLSNIMLKLRRNLIFVTVMAEFVIYCTKNKPSYCKGSMMDNILKADNTKICLSVKISLQT